MCKNKNQNISKSLYRMWTDYKEKPEYQTSVFPFPPRRKNLFDKVHDGLLGLITLGGIVWLAIKLINYMLR